MLNFVIMDDEMKHNLNMEKRLELIFKKHGMEAAVKLSSTEPSKVLLYSKANADTVNVYLLDVDVGCSMNGIELAHQIRELDNQSYIVYVSAHPEFVMSSLKTKVFDFLVKPISLETLENCIVTINKDFQALKKERKQTLMIKSGLHVYQVRMDEIIYFEKYGHLLVIHTLEGQLRSKDSLENIINKLDGTKFFKCHKSFVVNIDHITEIDNDNNLIYFTNKESCLLSKRCKKELNAICSSL